MATNDANETGPKTWVFDDQALGMLCEQILSASEVVMDLETTGLQEWAIEGGHLNGGVGARIVLASFTIPQRMSDDDWEWNGETPITWVLPLSHPHSPWRGKWQRTMQKPLDAMLAASIPLNNQNVKFDARWTNATVKRDLSSLITWDTQVSGHLLDETQSRRLKERAPRIFGIPPWNDHDLSYPGAAEQVPLFELGEYAARDTWWTWRLARHDRQVMFLESVEYSPMDEDEITDARLGKLATWVAMPTVASLTKIEQRGILLDVEWAKDRLAENEKVAEDSLLEMAHRYGLPEESRSAAPTSHWFRDWTQAAVEAGDLQIAALTPNGKPQWSKGVLARQARNGSEAAQLVLRQRGASKRAEYLRSWLSVATTKGTIHAQYNIGSVSTGRLSSSEPNMQQVTKALRPAFIPRAGYYFVELDYSQIELRVAAFISRSAPMIKAFQEGRDLHRMLAAVVVNKRRQHELQAAIATSGKLESELLLLPEYQPVTPEEVTPAERQAGKSANFGLLYEMGAYGFREYAETVYGVQLTLEEAHAIHAAFFEMWAGIREWHDRAKARAHRTGQAVSPLGRVRRLPGIWDGSDKMVSYAERAAINSPVQGMASDIMQMAAASIQGVLPGSKPVKGVHLVGTVHDSIMGEVRMDQWQQVVSECQYRMETAVIDTLRRMGVEFDVPLVADFTVGTRWGLSDVSDPQPEEPAKDRVETSELEESLDDLAE